MDNISENIRSMLKNSGISNFNQEAGWILKESSSPQHALDIAARRAKGEPLQYLLGTAPFRELMLHVDSRVLIPRPETELLAQWIIDNAPRNGKVLDMGCGSGAISISVAYERPDLMVTAADISADALEVARKNAGIYTDVHVDFIQSDLFDAMPECKFDIIGANLPYVTENEYLELDPTVRDFEPKLALTAPDNGLMLIKKTIYALTSHLESGGGAIFELSPHQAEETARMLQQYGFTADILPDLCGRERFVTGVLK